MSQTVVGVFDKSSEAQSAVESLVNSGFDRNTIDLSTRSTDYTDADDDNDHEGGISGFFSSLFGSDDTDRNKNYTTVGQRGSIVTVHADSADRAEQAADILDTAGAVDIDEKAQAYGQTGTYAGTAGGYANTPTEGTSDVYDLTAGKTTGTTTGAYATNPTTGTTDTDRTSAVVREGETMSVPIIEETLQVGKQTVETGEVRVRSRIVERPVEENVRLRTERVVVQRNPVDRVATDADFTAFKEGDLELTERAERAVVAKEARVVEEVTVGKTVDEHDETIRDTVRRTDVDVEQINPTIDVNRTTGTTHTNDDTRTTL